jgi:restriction endonuclease Mrr
MKWSWRPWRRRSTAQHDEDVAARARVAAHHRLEETRRQQRAVNEATDQLATWIDEALRRHHQSRPGAG